MEKLKPEVELNSCEVLTEPSVRSSEKKRPVLILKTSIGGQYSSNTTPKKLINTEPPIEHTVVLSQTTWYSYYDAF